MDEPAIWPHLTVITGPAGIGKTHLARTRLPRDRAVWVSIHEQHHPSELPGRLVRQLRSRIPTLPSWLSTAVAPSGGPVSDTAPLRRAEQLGSLIGQELATTMHRPMTLVIDDLELLDDEPEAIRLVESVVRTAPATLSIALITRGELPFPVRRLRSDDQLLEIDRDRLAIGPEAAGALLLRRWPELDELARRVVALAAGNAGALVASAALVADHVPAERAAVLDDLARRADDPSEVTACATLASYRRLVPSVRRVLDDLLIVGPTTVGDLGRLGHDAAAEHASELASRCLVDAEPGLGGERADQSDTEDSSGTKRSEATSPLESVRGVLRPTRAAIDVLRPDTAAMAMRAPDAVRLMVGRGDAVSAVAIAREHGDPQLLRDTLTRFGAAAIDASGGRIVLAAIEDVDDDELGGLAGRAAQVLGDRARAITEYERAAASCVLVADAWRHGLIRHFQGDFAGAARIYQRGIDAATDDDDLADTARLQGYAGSIAWIAGDVDVARDRAHASLEAATARGDDGALAVAYTLAAMVAAIDGDRMSNDWHYVQALHHAERAGDVLQIARIRSNRGSMLLEEGDYGAALDELDDAVRYAEIGGYDTMLGLALTNRGEVEIKLGRLDDARTDLAAAVELLQRQGTAVVAYPLVQLARLYTTRGDAEQARGASERALAITETAGDRQIHVAALTRAAAALIRLDPDEAWRHAQRAVTIGTTSLDAAEAWTVTGHLALERGDVDACVSAATTAIEIARGRHDRYALAAALELHGRAVVADRRRHWNEAFSLFDELGCPIEAARVELAIAAERLDTTAVARVAAVAEQARRLGARPLLAAAEDILDRHRTDDHALAVSVLGSFQLRLRGEPVPIARWQSRKARDLFKMLVALRGRPLTRDVAMERLWPEDDPANASSKLSVALATTRAVLDPDKEYPADHYVRAEGDAVVVDISVLEVDVEEFLTTAIAALGEYRRSHSERAIAMLSAVEARYAGDVFEDDPYVDWYATLREEVRAVYLTVARELAGARARAGDVDDAVRLYLRLLEREPYDESAHLHLIAALTRVGRHGDARRRYRTYADRMRELDLEPRSFAAVAATDPGS